jgi:catechol 2,3-dioxygenase-like lactoylglutathione lyase family enzyme
MIDHTSIGVANVAASAAFYESLTTSFAIYRQQAKIFVVPADGPVGIAAKICSICQ